VTGSGYREWDHSFDLYVWQFGDDSLGDRGFGNTNDVQEAVGLKLGDA
jgi:hypothetical protein